MYYKHLELLIYLADKTKLFSPLVTSTNQISSDMKVSQQTISRKLREMEGQGLITRKVSHEGHIITLTQETGSFLKEHSNMLQEILKIRKIPLTGTIVDGLGEGSYYLKKYKEKISRKLGFPVYPGTLNLKVNKEEIGPFLSSLTPVRIKGFKTKERTFGEVTCYKIKFKNIPAAIVIPARTKHENIVEIIAPSHLRDKFNLKTNGKITIKNRF